MSGHDSDSIALEIEAFAVAALVDAGTIGTAVADTCGVL